MTPRKHILFAAFLVAQSAVPAMAQLNDAPYFNLWTGTAANGDVGGGARLLLCGTQTLCNGDINASDNTVGTGYAIFTALEKNTGKGSGAIDPFLRFQHNEGDANGNATTEAAFNTSNNDIGTITNPNTTPSATTFANQAKDVNAGKDFNHAIKLSDLVLDSDGYFTFRLDINEPGGFKSQLRLDELQFFVANSDQYNKYTMDTVNGDATGQLFASDGVTKASKVWDMDWNKLNSAGVGINSGAQSASVNKNTRIGGLNLDNINDSGPAGSGDYDMAVRLHSSLFTNAASGMGDNAYVYLYNFAGEADPGNKDLGEAQAGFEEWAADVAPTVTPPTPGVPEPGTALLFGAGLIGIVRNARAKR
jgi:hypothetical protein